MDLIQSDYSGHAISFNENGAWFNATEAAAHFGKRPVEWLRLPETERYISALCDFHKVGKSHFVKTKRGTKSPGTWLHPQLAVAFARWCDVRFSIWCDDQIGKILSGSHSHFDWKRMRHAASASYQMMAGSRQRFRASQGKETLPHHYINESKLINFVLTGSYTPVDRSILTEPQLTILAKLEIQNGILIGAGLSGLERKDMLIRYRDSLISPALVHDQPLIEEVA